MPPDPHSIHHLRIVGINQTDLPARDGMRHVTRESDVGIEFHKGKPPLRSQLPHAFIISRACVVPMRTQDDQSRFTRLGTVVLRIRVVPQVVTIGHIPFDDKIEPFRIISRFKAGSAFLPAFTFTEVFTDVHVPVMDLHDHQSIHPFKFFPGIQRTVEHHLHGG